MARRVADWHAHSWLANGVVRFCIPIPSKQVAQWTDPSYDIGSYAASKLITQSSSIREQPNSDRLWRGV